uniref:Uncharacterized protein LOC114335676 n=1 Tax=Diabrotica virgifera virgifera TaxID=50390 RepID=A0A6P7FYV9_DIAVI
MLLRDKKGDTEFIEARQYSTERYPNFANYINVFMIKGIYRQWKQPICYTFSDGATNSRKLKNLIIDVIKELQNIGLTVVATVCDQGGPNAAAVYLLTRNPGRNSEVLPGCTPVAPEPINSLPLSVSNVKRTRVGRCTVTYVAGYVAEQVLKKVSCEQVLETILNSVKQKLNKMKFFDRKKQKLDSVPSLRNLNFTIRGFLYLKKKILKTNNNYLLLRAFQQDFIRKIFRVN